MYYLFVMVKLKREADKMRVKFQGKEYELQIEANDHDGLGMLTIPEMDIMSPDRYYAYIDNKGEVLRQGKVVGVLAEVITI